MTKLTGDFGWDAGAFEAGIRLAEAHAQELVETAIVNALIESIQEEQDARALSEQDEIDSHRSGLGL